MNVDGVCRLGCTRDSQCLLSEQCDQPTGTCLPKADPNHPEIALFEVGPTPVDPGGTIRIDYAVLFTEEVEIVARSTGGESPVLARTTQPTVGEVMFGPVNEPIEVVIRAFRGQETVDDSAIVQLRDPNSPRIERFEASPTTVRVGEETTLSWTVRDADQVSITNLESGDVTDGLGLEGEQAFTVRRNTEFLLRAENQTGAPAEARLNVEVEILEPPSVDTFVSFPEPVPHDIPAVLLWKTSNTSEVEVLEGQDPILRSLSLAEAIAGAWLVDPEPGRTPYSLVASGPQGEKTVTVEVEKLAPPLEPTITLTNAEPLLNEGEELRVAWTATPPDAQVWLTVDDGQPVAVNANDSFRLPNPNLDTTHEVHLRAEVPGGGVAEAHHTAYRVVQEANAAPDNPQTLDRAAVRGMLNLVDAVVDDYYEVHLPMGARLEAELVEMCIPDLTVEIIEPLSGATASASADPSGSCPKVSAISASGVLKIRVSMASAVQLDEIPYVLVPRVTVATCGDGVPQSGETCDDGNRRPNDGCNPDCELEAAFSYAAIPGPTGTAPPPPPEATQIRNWRPLDGGSGPTADEAYAVLPLPFEMSFYGRTYRGLVVYTNGFIGFLPDWSDQRIESTRPLASPPPWGVVSLFGTDLVVPVSAGVYVWLGQDDQEITIEYRNVVPKGAPSASLTGRITLSQNGPIRLWYAPPQGMPAAELQIGVLSPLGTYPAYAPGCDPSCGIEAMAEVGAVDFVRATPPAGGG